MFVASAPGEVPESRVWNAASAIPGSRAEKRSAQPSSSAAQRAGLAPGPWTYFREALDSAPAEDVIAQLSLGYWRIRGRVAERALPQSFHQTAGRAAFRR